MEFVKQTQLKEEDDSKVIDFAVADDSSKKNTTHGAPDLANLNTDTNTMVDSFSQPTAKPGKKPTKGKKPNPNENLESANKPGKKIKKSIETNHDVKEEKTIKATKSKGKKQPEPELNMVSDELTKLVVKTESPKNKKTNKK